MACGVAGAVGNKINRLLKCFELGLPGFWRETLLQTHRVLPAPATKWAMPKRCADSGNGLWHQKEYPDLHGRRGAFVKVFPAKTQVAELKAFKPNGYFISNGPGDPQPWIMRSVP